jgi:hypothetical protein
MDSDSVIPIDITRYDWGRRAMTPDQPFIENQDGTRSTHRMAAEKDEYGTGWAFPTIVQLDNGSLHHFEDHGDALKWNINRGEAVPFGNDKDSALRFAEGAYKQGTPLEERSY